MFARKYRMQGCLLPIANEVPVSAFLQVNSALAVSCACHSPPAMELMTLHYSAVFERGMLDEVYRMEALLHRSPSLGNEVAI